jgi:undecaprenyl-diphosphatase
MSIWLFIPKALIASSIVDLRMKETLYQQRTLLLSLTFLICFLIVAFNRISFSPINLSINLWAASINIDSFNYAAKLISIAFDTIALAFVTVVVATILFIFHKRRYSFLLLGAMTGAAVLVEISKTLTANMRPPNGIILATNFSFPSGHTTSTIVLFGLFTYLAWKHWKTKIPRVLTSALYVSMVVLVGVDRIYLNVHWLSDIVGAVFLGAFWLAFTIYIFNRLIVSDRIKPFLK